MLRSHFVIAIVSMLGAASWGAGFPSLALASSAEAELAGKLAPKFELVKQWAAEKSIVEAVKAHNTSPSAESKAMTQERWKSAAVLDPFVRSLSKGPAAIWLKEAAKKDEAVTEAFLSGADGCKVAFLSKTTSWCHKGKAKHDSPMTGKEWTGPVEVDESTGLQQVQIAVPVLDGGQAIGSLVVGFSVPKLKK